MIRPLALVIAAIQIANPSLSAHTERRYAELIRDEAERRYFDPYTGVAIIWNESRFHPGLVSRHGEEEYAGLAQIRLRNFAACRASVDAPACAAERSRLLQPDQNIRAMGAAIAANRALCRRRTGSAPFAGWLSGYQGHGAACTIKTPPRLTLRVMRYRAFLERQVPRQRRGLAVPTFR